VRAAARLRRPVADAGVRRYVALPLEGAPSSGQRRSVPIRAEKRTGPRAPRAPVRNRARRGRRLRAAAAPHRARQGARLEFDVVVPAPGPLLPAPRRFAARTAPAA